MCLAYRPVPADACESSMGREIGNPRSTWTITQDEGVESHKHEPVDPSRSRSVQRRMHYARISVSNLDRIHRLVSVH